MTRNRIFSLLALSFCLVCCCAFEDDCDSQPSQPQSASGVAKATVQVPTGTDGLTTEQHNVRQRLLEDNKPGAIKHLYIISPFSGQVILYSTVKGKVTSGGKRLTPETVTTTSPRQDTYDGIPIDIAGRRFATGEVLEDDGTYGHSGEYLYWWDVRGIYHQHYLTGGQIVHISSQPIPVKSVIINIESTQ